MDGGKIRDLTIIKVGARIKVGTQTKTKDGITIPIKAGTIVAKAGDNSHKPKDGDKIKVGTITKTKDGITQTKAGDRARIKDGAMGQLQAGVTKDTLATHGVQQLHTVGTTHSA